MHHKKDEIPEKEWLTKEGHRLHQAEQRAGGYKRRKLLVIALVLGAVGVILIWALFNR